MNSSSRLPSMNPNGILNSLVRDKLVPIMQLGRVFHRTRRDLVIAGTRGVIGNRVPVLGSTSGSFFFLREGGGSRISTMVTSLYTGHLPGTCKCSPFRGVRILTPSGGNRLKATRLGRGLRTTLGPGSSSGTRVAVNSGAFHANSGIVRVGGGCSVH